MAKTVTAAELQERLSAVLDELEEDGEEIEITRRGRVVARVVPAERLPRTALLGSLTFHGDITEPLGEDWDRES
jgi:prevent-host-death family protein